ncbi:MAG: VTT domain-containing protein [Chloroflexota bacterium]|nr:MAG: VTT domain-containing protein [Chloroflexota bacterium]
METIIDLLQEIWSDFQRGQLPQLGPWNYLLLSLLMIWQGPIASVFGGAAASAGLLKPGLVFVVGVAGNLTADIVWYSLGRKGNVDRLFERGKLGVHRGRIQKLRLGMQLHATKALLMAKLSFGLAVPTLVAAGLSGVSWRKWFPAVFIGETIFTGTLVLIGYFATEAIKQVEQGLHLFLAITTLLFIVAAIWFIPRLLRNDDAITLTGNDDTP